jgi:hypothetical protein
MSMIISFENVPLCPARNNRDGYFPYCTWFCEIVVDNRGQGLIHSIYLHDLFLYSLLDSLHEWFYQIIVEQQFE